MSELNFQAELAAIMAIPKKEVKFPTMPVYIYAQEAEDLGVWIVPDTDRLLARGLDPIFIDTLNSRIGALRYQQGIWLSDTDSRSRVEAEWKEQKPVGYELRAELFHNMRFAYDEDRKLKARLAEIAANSGDDDMVQDLMSLSVLGKKNPGPLQKNNYDLSKLATATTLSETLADLLAKNNDGKKKGSEVKEARDRAYTHLKTAVDQIRRYGKLEFWKEPERRKGYASDYRRK